MGFRCWLLFYSLLEMQLSAPEIVGSLLIDIVSACLRVSRIRQRRHARLDRSLSRVSRSQRGQSFVKLRFTTSERPPDSESQSKYNENRSRNSQLRRRKPTSPIRLLALFQRRSNPQLFTPHGRSEEMSLHLLALGVLNFSRHVLIG